MTLTIGSLFSGIGGLELGLERAGFGPTLWQVEKDPFCRRVLAKHWPDAQRFNDVTEVGCELAQVDIICGGFPCQDISHAGLGAGLAGSRSGLWSEYLRIIRAVRPGFVVVENVAALAFRGLDRVLGDLASIGFDAEWSMLSACAVGAPHTRNRLFIVAHANGLDGEARMGRVEVCDRTPVQRGDHRAGAGHWPLEGFGGVHGAFDGISPGVDERRALGNAVVPQCAAVVGGIIRRRLEAA